MQPSSYKALLVIADISGFTQFMKQHTHIATQARQIVVELLRAVISAASRPSGTLKLAEVEGDAAFFYAIGQEGDNLTREPAAIKKQVLSFFRTFYQTLQRLCALYPCAIGAQNLRLKVVIHAGEVAIEHIHGFDKLFGMDVILTHRLLKNSVPAPEYVLMTEAAYSRLGNFFQLQPERQAEYCEGIGVVETVVFFPPAQLIHARKKLDESFQSEAGNVPTFAHSFDHACHQFGAAPNVYLLPKPFRDKARTQPQGVVWLPQLQIKRRRETAVHLDHQGRQELSCGPSP